MYVYIVDAYIYIFSICDTHLLLCRLPVCCNRLFIMTIHVEMIRFHVRGSSTTDAFSH